MPAPSAPFDAPASVHPVRIHRFEVSAKPGTADPIGDAVVREAAGLGLMPAAVRATHVYLIQGGISDQHARRIAEELLADPVVERACVGASPVAPGWQLVEVHPLPGVMDPVAQSVELAVRDLVGAEVKVASGWRYDLQGLTADQAGTLARRLLANPVIQRVTTQPYHPADFPHGRSHEHAVVHVPLTGLSDDALTKLSRDAHLFLSLEEMRAIADHYRSLGREPTDVELETLAQTWSEHCVHKTLKSKVLYTQGELPRGHARLNFAGRPGHTVLPDGSVQIDNLLKSTVAAATFELIAEGVDWTLSVFKDNSGVVAFDDKHGVCIKVETHNRPSAIEPYGGAATGVGGCIRDVMGTGLGARPIANTDVFCVAFPEGFAMGEAGANAAVEVKPWPLGHHAPAQKLPKGVLHPRRILTQVVAGVRDYGNRMGIPTVNGAVSFDDRYIGNPLVFCGCVGVIPRSCVKGEARPGDLIVAVGGRTGRDGVHGATFSSAGLENTSADEFAHAVQIGNAIEEKRVLDALIRCRDEAAEGPLYTAMTDCGAGGFSSAVGEMGGKLGATVKLEAAPLKYDGLSYTEIWISEAQERMVLAVPPANIDRLKAICSEESVEIAVLGTFGTPQRDLVLTHRGGEVGRLAMHFIHDGIPQPVRQASWPPTPPPPAATAPATAPAAVRVLSEHVHLKDALLGLLSHPEIASKHWIIRQYDHEVRADTVVKPLVGPRGQGPADASVLAPVAGSNRGIAIGCGLATPIGDAALGGDPYFMALAAIDEAVRNLVCVGADPARIAILDNFCWPSCSRSANLGALVRACAGCYDGAKAYRTPFVSGKDSLNNQFTGEDGRVIEIPYTLLITGLGMVTDVNAAVTSDAKKPGNRLLLVGGLASHFGRLGGSRLQQRIGLPTGSDAAMPTLDLTTGPAAARAVAAAIARGWVASAHDVSDGGPLTAVAEMLIGAVAPPPGKPLGAKVNLAGVSSDPLAAAFGEAPSRYVLEVSPTHAAAAAAHFAATGIACIDIGVLDGSGLLADDAGELSAAAGDLVSVWRKPLDW